MAANLNKVQLIGNIGDIYPQNNDSVINFSLATNSSRKDKNTGEWNTEVEWHRIVCFGTNVEKVKKLSKGDYIYIEGSIKTNKWKDKTGMDKETKEIFGNDIKILKQKNEENKKDNYSNNSPTTPPTTYQNNLNNFDDDEIPF